MHRTRPSQILASLALVLAIAVSGYAQLDTTQTYTIGDSLTDNELVYLFFGTPPEIYGADPMEAVFDKAASGQDQLQNLAVLGSTTADVLTQAQAYLEGRNAGLLEPATLISLQGGGNDFLDLINGSANLFLLASAAPGENPAVDRIVNQARRNLYRSFLICWLRDRPQVVVWTAPDVSLTPYVLSFGFSSEELANIRAHVQRLNRSLRALDWLPNVAVLDTEELLTGLTFDPPEIFGVTIEPAPLFGFASAQFADPIHPTAVLNAIVANELIRELNREFRDQIPFYNEWELAELAGLLP